MFWFTGRVDTDRDTGTRDGPRHRRDEGRAGRRATLARRSKFSDFLTNLMPKTGVPISLERLKASLATAELEKKSVEGLKHDPPKIVVAQEVSELLLYDGEPSMLPIKDTELRIRRELRVRGGQGQEERQCST